MQVNPYKFIFLLFFLIDILTLPFQPIKCDDINSDYLYTDCLFDGNVIQNIRITQQQEIMEFNVYQCTLFIKSQFMIDEKRFDFESSRRLSVYKASF